MSERLAIKFARPDDESGIVAFLRDHWRRDHIFVTNPEVMRWQHRSPDQPDEALTFVLARRERDGEIVALLGYIPTRRFDRAADWSDLALAIWKVRDDVDAPGLGLQLLKTLQRVLAPDVIYAIGITPKVRPLYEVLGYTVGVLSHVALFPETKGLGEGVASGVPAIARRHLPDDPAIALMPVIEEMLPGGATPELIDSLGALSVPRKSWRYVLERYIRHPWYQYDVRIVCVDGRPVAVVVWRRVSTQRGSILRIVDVIGHAETIWRCGLHLREAVADSGCEYIDLVCRGDYVESMTHGGFVSAADHADMVLPNYFSPYEHRNVPIEFAFKLSGNVAGLPVRLCRADSDQDRPNRPGELNVLAQGLAESGR